MATATRDKADVIKAAREQLVLMGVRELFLFGSFVTDRQSPESDVDILVEFEPSRVTFDNFMDLSFFLEELLRRRVELVTPESLSPHIGPAILREAERVALQT